MKVLAAIFVMFSALFSTKAQLIVNEVMPVPLTGEPEWVELFNIGTKSLTLDSGWVQDTRSAVRLPKFSIPAGGFALLTRDTFSLRETRFIPPKVVMVECNLPSLNNTTDVVALRARDSSLLDSVYYNMKWGFRGISLERKYADSAAVSPLNWFASESSDSATAGEVNSIAPLNYDARIAAIFVGKQRQSAVVRVQNYGLKTLDSTRITVFADANGDNFPDGVELAAETKSGVLSRGQTADVDILFAALAERAGKNGSIQLVAVCNNVRDERRRNDTLRRSVFLPFAVGSVRINEIMFDPDANCSEYVEFINTTAAPINLGGWAMHDRPGATGADTVRFAGQMIVPPNGFAVVALDSLFFKQFNSLTGNPGVLVVKKPSFNLNSTGDVLVLLDPNGSVMDSLEYSDKWHAQSLSLTKGVSLEKIAPALPSAAKDSWSSCGAPAGGTPLAPNSIAVELAASGNFEAKPQPFILSGGANPVCLLSYSLPYRQARITVTIFTRSGQRVRTVANSVFTASEGAAAWDGRDEAGMFVETGAYIALLEAADAATGEIHQDKTVIVIGN